MFILVFEIGVFDSFHSTLHEIGQMFYRFSGQNNKRYVYFNENVQIADILLYFCFNLEICVECVLHFTFWLEMLTF